MSESLRDEFRVAALGFAYPEPNVFVRSQWSCPRWVYLVWRGLWLVWHIAVILASAINFKEHLASSADGEVKWFIYYPHLTFILTAVTCLVDLINVAKTPAPVAPNTDPSPAELMPAHSLTSSSKEEILFRGEFTVLDGLKGAPTPCLSRLTWLLYSIINSSNLLATAWYFAVSHDSHAYAIEVVAHVVNSVFVIGNLLMSAMPCRLLHTVYPMLYTALYVLFTLIYHEAGSPDSPIYEELDWDEAYPTAVTVVVGLLVVVPLLHAIMFAVFTFRLYLHARLNSASYSPGPRPETPQPSASYSPGPRPETPQPRQPAASWHRDDAAEANGDGNTIGSEEGDASVSVDVRESLPDSGT